ncbi:MAG: type II toxin-antitoxin system death-on-curing family toxin, partial [bacterium]|nr:type II toxin-antitoxin system death-on-curing family toxin [bacterium]
AVYARNIIANHPFLDGNKRTGMTCSSVFLEDNGYSVVAAEGMIEEFALRVIEEKLEIDAVAVWFKKHTKRI